LPCAGIQQRPLEVQREPTPAHGGRKVHSILPTVKQRQPDDRYGIPSAGYTAVLNNLAGFWHRTNDFRLSDFLFGRQYFDKQFSNSGTLIILNSSVP
jgi:hypothetical protein